MCSKNIALVEFLSQGEFNKRDARLEKYDTSANIFVDPLSTGVTYSV